MVKGSLNVLSILIRGTIGIYLALLLGGCVSPAGSPASSGKGTKITATPPPIAPTYSSFSPSSPSVSTTPVIKGSASADAVKVNFYSDSTCSTLIGSGTTSEYSGAGITLTLSSNTTTIIYAKALNSQGNGSPCTSIAEFTHDSLPPSDPTFSSTIPVSPNNSSITPLILGSASSDTATIAFYSDSACTSSLGSGTKALYEGAGISLTVGVNTTTAIYGKATDSAGNVGNCVSLTSFTHNSLGPGIPTFTSTSPASPSNSSTTPAVIGTASANTVTMYIYSNSICTSLLNSGTRAAYIGAGITVTVTANTTTTLYANAVDVFGTFGACTSLTSYTHDSTSPTAPASLSDGNYLNSTTASPALSWSASSDSGGTGVSYYQVSLGISAGDTSIVTWTDVGNVTTHTFTGISPALSSGTTYYANVRAVDIAGNTSSVTSSNGWTVDTTNPTAVASVTDGTYEASLTASPALSWAASTDTGGSGVSYYEVSLGTSAGNTSIVTWTNVGNVTAHTFTPISPSLVSGTTYYANVRSVDNSGNTSSVTSGDGWMADNTVPATISSVMDGTYSSSVTASPALSWSASSDTGGSGISYYEVSVGTSAGATDSISWTNVGNVTTYTFTSISPNLVHNTTYYSNVRARDNAGNVSAVTSSDGWLVDTSAPGATSPVSATLSTTTRLTGSWTATTDAQTGIASYQYSIGSTSGGTEVKGWTSVASGTTSVDVTSGISMDIGTTYYLNVKAVNGAGTEGAVTTGSVECADLTSGLKAFFQFEDSGNLGLDSSGAGNSLTNQTATTQTTGGIINNAVDITTSHYLFYNCGAGCPFSVNATTKNFTISVWVKFDDVSAERVIISKTEGNSGTDEYFLTRRTQGGGTLRFGVNAKTLDIGNATFATTTGVWYHIVVWFEANAPNEMFMKITRQDAPATTYSSSANQNTNPTQQTTHFRIGNGNGSATFDGKIDLVGFWDRILTSKERDQLYNSNGSAGLGAEPPFY